MDKQQRLRNMFGEYACDVDDFINRCLNSSKMLSRMNSHLGVGLINMTFDEAYWTLATHVYLQVGENGFSSESLRQAWLDFQSFYRVNGDVVRLRDVRRLPEGDDGEDLNERYTAFVESDFAESLCSAIFDTEKPRLNGAVEGETALVGGFFGSPLGRIREALWAALRPESIEHNQGGGYSQGIEVEGLRRALTARQREVLGRWILCGGNASQAARELGVTNVAVIKVLQKAVENLREYFASLGFEVSEGKVRFGQIYRGHRARRPGNLI